MKQRVLWTCLLVVALTITAWAAAQAQSLEDAIQVTRAKLQADRQAIVAQAMGLTDAEAQVFWPLYREYRAEIEKHNDALLTVVKSFADAYDTLTDEQATQLLQSWLEAQNARRYTLQKFSKRFLKILPPKKTLRFCQTENKLDAILMYELTGVIPLAQ